MKDLQLDDIKPIEGFKVMEWLREVREKQHKLYEQDPKEYYRQLELAGERIRLRLKKDSRKLARKAKNSVRSVANG
jgi:hypothetical protein